MRRIIPTAVLLAFAGGVSPVLAHGVRHSVSEGATVVGAAYDDGTPMAFCDVSVFAPDNGPEAYQTGTTDRNGRFAFLADTNGIWQVVVDDGMGHRIEARIDIDRQGHRQTDLAATPDRVGGAVIGVSVILGCFGLYALFARRGTRRRKPKALWRPGPGAQQTPAPRPSTSETRHP